jgi:hypothetical protein
MGSLVHAQSSAEPVQDRQHGNKLSIRSAALPHSSRLFQSVDAAGAALKQIIGRSGASRRI